MSIFSVSKRKDLAEKILPFFENSKLQTIKQLSFLRWKKALTIFIENKNLNVTHFDNLNRLFLDETHKRPKK
jgi:hypothetical protein